MIKKHATALLTLLLTVALPFGALADSAALKGEYTLAFPSASYGYPSLELVTPKLVLDFDGRGAFTGTIYYRGALIGLDADRKLSWEAPASPGEHAGLREINVDSVARVRIVGSYTVDELGYVEAEFQTADGSFVELIEDPGCPEMVDFRKGGDLEDQPNRLEFLLTDDGRSFWGELHGLYRSRKHDVVDWQGNANPGEWKDHHHLVEVQGQRRISEDGSRLLRDRGDQLRDLP